MRKRLTGASSVSPIQNSRSRVMPLRTDAEALRPREQLLQGERFQDAVERNRDIDRASRPSRDIALEAGHDDLRKRVRHVLDLLERWRVELDLRIPLRARIALGIALRKGTHRGRTLVERRAESEEIG